MIRALLFLLLVALAACSPSRQIAVSATDAQARAGTIARLATHIGSVSVPSQSVIFFDVLSFRLNSHTSVAIPPRYRFHVRVSVECGVYASH